MAQPQARLGTFPFAVLRHTAFRRLWLGVMASASGTWLRQLAASVLILEATGSAAMVGVLNFATFLPMLLLGLVGGDAVDRWSSRRVLIVTQTFSASVSLLLAGAAVVSGLDPVFLITACAAQGISYAFAKPATQAAIPSIVPPADLARAVALNSLAFTMGLAVGPVVAAAVLGTIGSGVAFLLDSLSYCALLVAALHLRAASGTSVGWNPSRILSRVAEGIRFVSRDTTLVAILVGMATSTVAIESVKTLMPVFAERRFGMTASWGGILVGLFGCGSLLAASVAPRWDLAHGKRASLLALLALAGSGVAFAQSSHLYAAVPLLLVGGFSFMTATVLMTAEFFRRVPGELRGRVLAIHSLSFLGVSPFAALVSGTLAERFGVAVAGTATALVAVAGAISFARRQIDF